MVDLSLELHIAPNVLFNKMCQIANLETPRVERFWELYGNNPKKLKRAVNLLREMWGFNNALEFYDGVETNESFEKDFKPIAKGTTLTPVALTLILDLYFRLTPITMVASSFLAGAEMMTFLTEPPRWALAFSASLKIPVLSTTT